MPPNDGPAGGALGHLPWPKPEGLGRRLLRLTARAPRLALRVPILAYRYTLSSFMGRQCRYLPTCSDYADEAISRHGAWPGLFMATARLCRCHPWGGHGYDPVPASLPEDGRWYAPWRYGRWRFRPEPPDA
ncbi:membrane protein insertion efficiency factor YidD [Xanthobacter sediminis]